MKKLTPFEQELVDLAGELAVKLSYARSVGQVFGLLYLRPDPLSLDDVSEGLSMSKGGVSMALRALEEWGAIRRAAVRGSRRSHYTAESDLAALAMRRVEGGLRSRLAWAQERLRRAADGAGKAADPEILERIKSLAAFMSRAERLLDRLPKLRPLLKLAGVFR